LQAKAATTYLLAKPAAFEDHPFGPDVTVFKVRTKMFATLSEKDGVPNMNLKCDPLEADILRDIFEAVVPGYHMNKAHWNTLILDGSIPCGEIERMIDKSYELVVRGMKKSDREYLETRFDRKYLYTQVDASE
jgi:predicted DNA-binding protein (MmcQ/YjbR family)